MAKNFDEKFAELEREKSKLDLAFLQSQKQECEKRIAELLKTPLNEGNEEGAVLKFNEVQKYYSKKNEIDEIISSIPEKLKIISEKISKYQKYKAKFQENTIQYRETEEGIAEILGGDVVYQYAKEINDEELIEKLKKRTLTLGDYITILNLDYPKYLARKHDKVENMYNELFGPILDELDKEELSSNKQKKKLKKGEVKLTAKTVILLPEGMTEQIYEELKENKDIQPKDIESFLKKELKKNAGEIKISHIKNTFKEKYVQAYEYIRRLIINYPGFRIIDNSEQQIITPSQSKHEKLKSVISSEESQEYKNERLRRQNLLSKLKEIGNNEGLKSRILKYINLFEEIDCKFSDKENFGEELYNAISFHTHVQIEKEIQKILTSIIQDNLRLERTGLYGYFAYKLSRGCDNRRIVAYPNGEIFTICSHEDYEKLINTQPPVEKSK